MYARHGVLTHPRLLSVTTCVHIPPQAPHFGNVSKSSAKLFGAEDVTTRPAPEPPVAPTRRSKSIAVVVPKETMGSLSCKYCNKASRA